MLGVLRFVVLMTSLMLAAPGQAQSPPAEQEIKVPSGQEVQLVVLNNTGADCSGLPTPDVRIQEPPRGGIIIVRFGQSSVPETAPRCAGRQIPGLGVFYRANGGFSGPDRVRIETGAPGQPSQAGQTFRLILSP
jgi:hypothetical protein